MVVVAVRLHYLVTTKAVAWLVLLLGRSDGAKDAEILVDHPRCHSELTHSAA